MSHHTETLQRLHLRPSFNSVISLEAVFVDQTRPQRKPSPDAIKLGKRLRAIDEHHQRRALARELGMTFAELTEAGL